MTHIVRKSPSGPILFEVGRGFTTQRQIAQVTGAKVAIPSDGTNAYLGTDADAANAAQAYIGTVKAGLVYRAEVQVLLDYSKVASTTTASLVIEYSTNGTTWNTWKESSISVPLNNDITNPPGVVSNGLFRQTMEARSDVDAITFADGETLRVRAAVHGENGIGGMFYLGGANGGFASVAIAEELAS